MHTALGLAHIRHAVLLMGWCMATAAALPASAQSHGTVLSSTPIYDVQMVPHTTCEPANAQSAERCTTQMLREEQLLGYDVRYSYQGQQFVQRMPHDPGPHVAIQAPSPAHSYSSTQPTPQPDANPTRKSYGSASAGAAQADVVEYRPAADTLPIYIELPAPPLTQRPPASPWVQHPHP
jgi:hypothetical protein